LELDALLQLAPDAAMPAPSADGTAEIDAMGSALLAALQGPSESLALVQRPAAWPAYWQPLLAAVLQAEPGSFPALVTAAADGPLLRSEASQGWLLGTGADQPPPEALAGVLAAEGLIAAPLPVEGDPDLRVWTRLEAGQAGSRFARGNANQLQASLEGARSSQGRLAWWGQTLAVLQEQRDSRKPPRLRLEQLAGLDLPQAPLQWAMAAGRAQPLLQRWSTWQLLSALAGQPLAPAVQSLSLGWEAQPDANLHLKARLEFG
jgi:hypothetical protein